MLLVALAALVLAERPLPFEFRQRLGAFGWYANATVQETEILENRYAPASVGKQFTGVPATLFNLGFDVTWQAFSFALDGRSQDKAYRNDDNGDTVNGVYGGTDPRTTWNAKVRWKAMPSLELSLAVDNLFDRRFYDFYRGPGRSYLLQARASY